MSKTRVVVVVEQEERSEAEVEVRHEVVAKEEDVVVAEASDEEAQDVVA